MIRWMIVVFVLLALLVVGLDSRPGPQPTYDSCSRHWGVCAQ